MFSFLKKKLKQGIEKISKKVKQEEEEKIEEVVEEIKKEEYIEESKEELIKEVEEEIEKEPEIPEEKPEEMIEEIEEELTEVGEKLGEVVEKEAVEEVPKKEIKPEVKEKKKIGILKRIRRKVTEKKITEDDLKDILEDLKISLIESDVTLEVAEKISDDLKSNLVGKFIKRKQVEKVIRESFRKSILDILDVETFDLLEKVKTKKPFLIVFLGFNGSGKTTSIARIGHLLKQKDFKCVFAAADCFRAASIEQLEEHGRKLGIKVIKHKYGADPAAVVFDAAKHAKSKDIDVVLADTAGRTHANVSLMEELKKIIRVNKPDLKILVLDALTGNDIYDQCKMFNDAVGVDALVITKADVYEKGGAALSASHTIGKPILYLGIGQNYEDLEKFDPNKIVEKLLE